MWNPEGPGVGAGPRRRGSPASPDSCLWALESDPLSSSPSQQQKTSTTASAVGGAASESRRLAGLLQSEGHSSESGRGSECVSTGLCVCVVCMHEHRALCMCVCAHACTPGTNPAPGRQEPRASERGVPSTRHQQLLLKDKILFTASLKEASGALHTLRNAVCVLAGVFLSSLVILFV